MENNLDEVDCMLRLATTPKIAKQSDFWLSYQIRSRSRQGIVHNLLISEAGQYDCGCEAFKWGNECWHKQATTIKSPSFTLLGKALEVLKDHTKQPIYAWNHIGCTMRDFYRADQLYCRNCNMYPEICNIHPIAYSRNKKPLVWKIQTALIRGRRKEASRLLKQFIKQVAREKLALAEFYGEAFDERILQQPKA